MNQGRDLWIHDPYATPGTYHKVQLHCHTTNSDGAFPVRELLHMYREAGYTFVAITDHERITRYEDLNSETFLVIPGVENTIVRGFWPLGPHLTRLWVAQDRLRGAPQEWIHRTVEEGGVVVLSHPSWKGNLWTGEWSRKVLYQLQGYHLMEIFNPHSDPEEDVRRWVDVLRWWGPPAAVGGIAVDDCHNIHQFNVGWVMAKVEEVSAPALRKALLNHSFYASTGPEAEFGVAGGRIYCRLNEASTIRFYDQYNHVLLEACGDRAEYAPLGDEGFVRVECRTAGGKKAWSQPFWVERVRPPVEEIPGELEIEEIRYA